MSDNPDEFALDNDADPASLFPLSESAPVNRGDEEIMNIVEQSAWQLCALWNEYRALYERPEDCATMNQAARGFARLVQVCMMEILGLGVCRLLDPPRTAGKRNATLPHLMDVRRVLEPNNALLEVFDGRVAALKLRAQNVRKIRDKVVAHLDLDVAAKREFPKEDLGVVRDLVVDIGRFVQDYEREFRRTDVNIVDHRFRSDVGAERLLAVLRASPLINVDPHEAPLQRLLRTEAAEEP